MSNSSALRASTIGNPEGFAPANEEEGLQKAQSQGLAPQKTRLRKSGDIRRGEKPVKGKNEKGNMEAGRKVR